MADVHHLDEGDGPPLVLLHSGGMSSHEWQPHLEHWTRRFRVIAPDLPGHGRTQLEGDRIQIPEMGQRVLALLDELSLERFHLLGSSMGGALALWIALEAPDRLRRLVLFRAGFRRNEGDEANARWMADPTNWERLGLADELSRVHEPQGGPEAWKDVITRVAATLDPDERTLEIDPSDLDRIQAPTLLIVGDRDPLVPLDEAMEMYERIPDADLWVLPHATHVAATKTWRREHFEQEVVRFLRSKRHEDGADLDRA